MLNERAKVILLLMLLLSGVAFNGFLVRAQKPDALVNGIITKTNKNDAKGSWKYVFNGRRGVHELDIRIVEQTPDGVREHRLRKTWGSRSGYWGLNGPFIHVAKMRDIYRNEERWVYVFAWGDAEKFEAAILPDTPENEELFRSVFDLHYSEVIDFIKTVIASSDYVIYGETKYADF